MYKSKFKKIFSFIAITSLCITLLSACASSDDSVQSNQNSVESSDTVVVVNGEKITVSKFGFYIFNAAYDYAELTGNFSKGLNNIDWNATDETTGKIISEIIKENAKNLAITDILMSQNGAKNNLSVEEEMIAINNAVDKSISEKGDDFFNTRILAMGITSVDDYKDLMEITAMSDKLQEDFDQNPEKYITSDLDLSKFKSDDNVTVQHILIKSNSTKTSDPQATINEVCQKAKSGEDFLSLMEEYNEDTEETDAGYYFGRGIMSAEFEETAFALNLNEISDVVRTEHGYHVIKRLPGMGELLNMWKSTSLINENANVIKSISVEDIINQAAEAAIKLQNEYSSTENNEAASTANGTPKASASNSKNEATATSSTKKAN